MQRVNKGDLSVQIPVDGSNEVREAQQAFNAMTRQLTNQISQIKTEQQLIADTEMKAMQNQINAHFLYNVLETIHMQAVLADNDDTSVRTSKPASRCTASTWPSARRAPRWRAS